jgi:hypothetical protein
MIIACRDVVQAAEHVGGGTDLGVLVVGQPGRGGAGRAGELAQRRVRPKFRFIDKM